MLGPWVALDLSAAVFMSNPATPGSPFGQYTGGKIQPITFGSGLTIAFEHPAFDFTTITIDALTRYDLEVTYDLATVWTRMSMGSRSVTGATAWWNEAGQSLGDFGAFDATNVPVLVATIGPGIGGWNAAVVASHDAIVFGFPNRAIITGIRYRTNVAPVTRIVSTSWDTSSTIPPPPPPSSPYQVDFTNTLVYHAGTKVGPGNVLGDSGDATYFDLTGYANTDSSVTSAGWILLDLPAIPDFVSFSKIALVIRAQFTPLSGSPLKGTMRVFFTGRDGSGTGSGDLFPFEFSQYYALLLPGGNYPDVGPLPTGVQTYTYSLVDWRSQSDDTMDHALAVPLQEGEVKFALTPQYHYSDPNGSRIEGKIYEVSLKITYNVYTAPVLDPPPVLPDGYGDWQTFDLSTAVFPGGYGKYDPATNKILSDAGGWPDFYFPGFVMDPANDYYFQFVFDGNDPREDTHTRVTYIWMLDPDRPEDSYFNDPFYPLHGENGVGDYVLVHLDTSSPNWEVLATGMTMPLFEIYRDSVLAELRYAVLVGDSYIPPVPVEPRKLARVHYWGQ